MNGISGVTQDEDFVIDSITEAERGMEEIDDVLFQPTEVAIFKLAVYIARKVIMRHVLRRRGCRVPPVDQGWLMLAQEFIQVFSPETTVSRTKASRTTGLLSSPKPTPERRVISSESRTPHSTRRMSSE